jgi:hypothetical protein
MARGVVASLSQQWKPQPLSPNSGWGNQGSIDQANELEPVRVCVTTRRNIPGERIRRPGIFDPSRRIAEASAAGRSGRRRRNNLYWLNGAGWLH